MMFALFFYASGIAFMRARLRRRKEPLVRILLVHHIKDVAKFGRMVRFLAARYHMISFDDLAEKRFSARKINVLLSMDDGYASWFEKGLTILEKYSVPALFFISSGFLEADAPEARGKFLHENLRLKFHSEPLTGQMVEKLAGHPLVEIGGHTRTHPFLTTLSDEETRREIADDKKALERKTGGRVRVFAYPFGDYNDRVRRAAGAEYAYAMTTDSDFYSPSGDALAIPRSNHGTVSNAILHLWVLGAFDLAEMTIALLRRFFRLRFRGRGVQGQAPHNLRDLPVHPLHADPHPEDEIKNKNDA